MSDLSILPGEVQRGGKEAPDEAGANSHKAVPFSFRKLGLFTNSPVVRHLILRRQAPGCRSEERR